MLLIKEKEPDCRLFLSATPETRRKWNNIYRLLIGWDPVKLTFFDKMKGRYGDMPSYLSHLEKNLLKGLLTKQQIIRAETFHNRGK